MLDSKMKVGCTVITVHGFGTLISRENDMPGSFLHNRWLVKIQDESKLSTFHKNYQKETGGLYFYNTEIQEIKSNG